MRYIILMLLTLQLHSTSLKADKVGHILVGSIIYSSCYLFTKYDEKECLVPVVAAAIGKELYDMTGRGNPEALDAIATVAIPFGSYTVFSW